MSAPRLAAALAAAVLSVGAVAIVAPAASAAPAPAAVSAKAPSAPATPTGVTASSITPTSAVLLWNVGTGARSWLVSLDGGAPVATSSAVFPVSGLAPASTHTVTVVAVDAKGRTSAPSAPVSFTTLATTAISTPTGLTASDVTASGFTLRWAASTGGYGIVNYDVYVDGVYRTSTIWGGPVTTVRGTSGSTVTVTVQAWDQAGARSAVSAPLVVTLP